MRCLPSVTRSSTPRRLSRLPFFWLLALLMPVLSAGGAFAGNVSVSVTASNMSPCPGQPVTFTASGSPSGCEGAPGTPTYQWSVGGSNIGGATSQTYTTGAPASGSLTPTCTVSFGSCGSGSGSTTVTVNSTKITCNSIGGPGKGTQCTQLTFTASATGGCGGGAITYAWTVDGAPNGSTTGPTLGPITLGVGQHTIGVTARDSTGSASAPSKTVTVTSGTITCTGVNPSPGSSGTTCTQFTFTASATGGCGGGAITYGWTVDNSPAGTNRSTLGPITLSATPSTHTVKVTVTDSTGSASAQTQVTVTPGATLSVPPPTASPNAPDSCTSVTITASPTPGCTGNIVSYTWNFGDGSPSLTTNGGSVSHTFPAGSFSVSVTVTDSTGASASGTLNPLTVTDATPGTPSGLRVTAATPTYINLAWQAASPSGSGYTVWRSVNGGPFSQASAGGTSYQDNSVQASTASQTMSYCYYVTATSICGTQGGASNTVCATTPCQSNIQIQTASPSQTAALIGQSITYTATASDSCGQNLTYTWNFDDGTTLYGDTAIHSYVTTGQHTADLEVSDGLGQKSKQVGPVTVYGGTGRSPAPGDPYGGGGPDSGADGPGQSPGSPHYHHCQQACGGSSLGSTTVCTDTFTGNTRIVRKDPIATRGFPINVNVTLNTETIRFDRPAGNGCLSYDIFVGLQNVYDGSCHATAHWFVVDGDGTQNDFGSSASDPKATYGIFSTLQVLKTTHGVLFGYQLVHAGPPENVKAYGNFTYSFNALGQLVQMTDPQGNAQTLTYVSNGYPNSPQIQRILDVSTQKSVTFDYDGTYVKHIYLGGGQTVNTFTYQNGNLAELDVQDGQGNTLNAAKYTYNADGTLDSFQKDNNTNSNLKFAYTPYPSNDCSQPIFNFSSGGSVGSVHVIVINIGSKPPADTADRVVVTNAQGGQVVCDYDTHLNMFRMFKPMPAGASGPIVYHYAYNADHEITSMSDGTSQVSFSYNESPYATNPGTGVMTGVTDSLNNSWAWGWNGADLTSATDPVEASAGVSDTAAYTDVNQPHVPTSVTDGANNTWTLAHNAHGQVTQVTPPSGSPTQPATVTYDEASGSPTLGYPQLVTDGNGNKATFDAYDLEGDLLQASSYPVPGNPAVRDSILYTYDSAQRVTKVTLPDNRFTQAVYVGKDLDHVIDEAGTQTNYTYCANCGALTGITGLLGYSLSWAFDVDKDLTSYTDPNSHTTAYTYGQAEELQKVTYPDNSTLGFLYDASMTLRQITNGRGHRIALGYDGDERLHQVTFPTGGQHPLTYDYNVDGSLKDFTDGVGTTSYAYAVNGWLQSVKYDYSASGLPGVQELDYQYYPDGLPLSVTWKNASATVGAWTYGYDTGGRLTSVQNPWSETTTWAYDGEDKLTAQTNANGTSTSYAYNQARGWVTGIAQSLGASVSASYGLTYDNGADTVGLLTNVLQSDGGTNSFGYDPLYRLTAETGLPGIGIANASFETPSAAQAYGGYVFNPANAGWAFNGQPGNGSGVTTNSSPGLTAGIPNSPYGSQVGFLQAFGSMSQALTGFQSGVSYTLTVAAAQRAGAGGGQTFQVLLDGNPLGNVTPTGTTYTDYSVGPFTTTVGNHTLQLAGIDPQGGDHTAFLDNIRLSAAPAAGTPATHSYGYDLAGNHTSIDGFAYTFDGANKISSGPAQAFAYDGDGNTTSGMPFPPTGYNGSSYVQSPNFIVYNPTWDDLNRMVSIGGNGPPMAFGYDARGLRVTGGIQAGGSAPQTFYIHDGGTLLGEVTVTPQSGASPTIGVTAAYTWGAAGPVSERRLNSDGSGRSLWYHFGPQGETRQLTDATGAVADTYSYSAYGILTGSAGSGDVNPFRYGGQFGYYTDWSYGNGGLVLCGLRWYDPNSGRFLSRDPIDYAGGPNLYGYCGGDPVNMADPDGTQSIPGYLGGGVPTDSIDPQLYSPEHMMDNADALLGWFPPYNLATALTGRDAFGRCLSTPDRLLRGISGALPMLGKLRGLGGFTRAAGAAGCSFAPGTPVVMADGTSRPVESIHAGDRVLARSEKTGRLESQEVTSTVHHPAATLVTVTLSGADGKAQALVCTPEHPFFVDGRGWVEAGSLGIGTQIVTRAGPSLSVRALGWQRSEAAKPAYTVYNFTVDEDHTFFVGSVSGGAWTHNSGCNFVNWGQQGKHLIDHPNFIPGRSILLEDAQKMLSELGSGVPVRGVPGTPGSQEAIDFGRVIGIYKDLQGNVLATTRAKAHYGGGGVHFVPALP